MKKEEKERERREGEKERWTVSCPWNLPSWAASLFLPLFHFSLSSLLPNSFQFFFSFFHPLLFLFLSSTSFSSSIFYFTLFSLFSECMIQPFEYRKGSKAHSLCQALSLLNPLVPSFYFFLSSISFPSFSLPSPALSTLSFPFHSFYRCVTLETREEKERKPGEKERKKGSTLCLFLYSFLLSLQPFFYLWVFSSEFWIGEFSKSRIPESQGIYPWEELYHLFLIEFLECVTIVVKSGQVQEPDHCIKIESHTQTECIKRITIDLTPLFDLVHQVCFHFFFLHPFFQFKWQRKRRKKDEK